MAEKYLFSIIFLVKMPCRAPKGKSSNSAIHKAAGLMVPSRSIILPGTIPETPISREWSRQ